MTTSNDTSVALDLDDEVDLTAPIAPMEPREAEAWLAEIDAARGNCDPSAETRAGYRIEAALRGVLQQRASLDASAQAFDDLVARAWRAATGNTHEGPASVDDMLRRIGETRKAREGFRAALLDVHEALDGVRPEPDFDMPAELGSYACEEIGRRVAAARREGAEAMREACAEAMATMAHAEGVDAERFRLTRGEDSAAEHLHRRAALLAARVEVLGLPLPEVTP